LRRYNLAGDRAMAKNVQASLEYTTLHSVAGAYTRPLFSSI
jgi:hypothetical protein